MQHQKRHSKAEFCLLLPVSWLPETWIIIGSEDSAAEGHRQLFSARHLWPYNLWSMTYEQGVDAERSIDLAHPPLCTLSHPAWLF